VIDTAYGIFTFGYYSSKKNAMKKTNRSTQVISKLILAPILLFFVATNAIAQDVTAKDILAQAAKATLDKENIATARGTGIKGKFTAVSGEQNEDLQSGFYAGILELEVTGDNHGPLKSGTFNLFFKNGKQGLKLYMEENGSISNIFEVTQTAPKNYKATRSSGKPELAFLEQLSDENTSTNFNQILSRSIGSLGSYTVPVKPAMWLKVCSKKCRWARVY
jgi:hypothetical protein